MVSATFAKTVLRRTKMALVAIVGLVLVGALIKAPPSWLQTKKPAVVSMSASYAPHKKPVALKATESPTQGEQMGNWVHGPHFPKLD